MNGDMPGGPRPVIFQVQRGEGGPEELVIRLLAGVDEMEGAVNELLGGVPEASMAVIITDSGLVPVPEGLPVEIACIIIGSPTHGVAVKRGEDLCVVQVAPPDWTVERTEAHMRSLAPSAGQLPS